MLEQIDLVGKIVTCKIRGIDCKGIILSEFNGAVFLNNEFGWTDKNIPEYKYAWYVPRYLNIEELKRFEVTDLKILEISPYVLSFKENS
jgi:hypothetical protein